MEFKLVVVEAFDNYKRGDIIEDEHEVEVILAGEHEPKVRKVNAQEV